MEFSEEQVTPGRHFVVAISDVHLGHWNGETNKKAFEDFVDGFLKKATQIDYFVILGDFLDLWRRDDDQLLRDNMMLLQKLVNLKKDGPIESLQYVVGNHDYLIPWYKWLGYTVRKESRKRRTILNEFEFTEGSSADPKNLELPRKSDKVEFKDKFVFRHGHQDGPGQAGAFYDEVCTWLCYQGNTGGWITSKIWEYKAYIPAIVAVVLLGLAGLFYFSGMTFWSIILTISSVISICIFIWMIRQEELKIRKLDEEKQKAIVDQQKSTEIMKRGMDEEELWMMFPERTREKIFARIRKAKAKVRTKPTENLIVGHTHVPFEEPPNWNLGSWIEGDFYPFLIIDHDGKAKLHHWPYKEN